MKAVKSECKIWKKKNIQNTINTISIGYFLQTHLFTEKFSRMCTIHPGISADGHYIASHDQFKPVQ